MRPSFSLLQIWAALLRLLFVCKEPTICKWASQQLRAADAVVNNRQSWNKRTRPNSLVLFACAIIRHLEVELPSLPRISRLFLDDGHDQSIQLPLRDPFLDLF